MLPSDSVHRWSRPARFLRHGTRLLSLCALLFPMLAQADGQPVSDAAAIAAKQAFARNLARQHGWKADQILATLDKARYQQNIIDAITRPAEAKPWNEYRPIFVNMPRVVDGTVFYHANAKLLNRTAQEYGVPASIIVSIIGVESNYGRTPMRYRVLDALNTLAFYYPPRQKFFRSELAGLFELHGSSFPYELDELMGSYAGAMGWAQFMPSSIAQFARDGDGDGKLDLWNSLPDICASVANYFKAHGWVEGGPVAMRVKVSANARKIDAHGSLPVYPLEQLAEWGYQVDSKLDPTTPATLLTLDGDDGPETWITFQNFYVITRYNRSPLYSMAVYQLSEAIAAAEAALP